jgi:hypothetical protein
MTPRGHDEHDRTRDIIDDERRARPQARTLLVMYVVLPMAMAMAVWLWIRHERAKVRERGVAGCIASGKDGAWCEAAADKHHERCMELTFRPSTRTSPESFEVQGYVECLDIGDQAYWKVSAERAAERRRREAHPER